MQPILMPIDFSDVTDRVVDFVSEIAQPLGVEIIVLHVSQTDLDDPEQGRMVLSPKIDEVINRLKAKGCKAHPLLVFGSVAASIMDQINAKDPAMVVMGSHGHSALYDLIMGSMAGTVLRSGKCPVLIVPSPKPDHWEPDPADIEAYDWPEYGYFPG